MQSVSGLLYSLYRITLVDEYEYAAMVTVDGVMAPLLCGTFLAASSILCVNLLIALLTDTFQRSEVTPAQCPQEAVALLRRLSPVHLGRPRIPEFKITSLLRKATLPPAGKPRHNQPIKGLKRPESHDSVHLDEQLICPSHSLSQE